MTPSKETPEAGEVGKMFVEKQKEMVRLKIAEIKDARHAEFDWSEENKKLDDLLTLTETIIQNVLAEVERVVEGDLVKHMVDRFLGWRLPKDFHPDGGISFEKEYNVSYNANQGLPPSIHEPSGTNLFTAEQAKEMFRFLLENEDGTSSLTTVKAKLQEIKSKRV